MAIILGAIFVVLEIRDNKKMIEAATEQAKAAAIQADASAKQIQQNIEIADMDIIMRLYEFANTREAQTSYLTVVNSNLKSYDDFLKLSKEDQVSFLQVSSLFESIGVLLDRGIITLQTVDDMFVPEICVAEAEALHGRRQRERHRGRQFPLLREAGQGNGEAKAQAPQTRRALRSSRPSMVEKTALVM